MYNRYIPTHLRKWMLPNPIESINDSHLEIAVINKHYRYFAYQLSHLDLAKIPSALVQKEEKTMKQYGKRETWIGLTSIRDGAYGFMTGTAVEGFDREVLHINELPYSDPHGNRITVFADMMILLIVARYGTPKFVRISSYYWSLFRRTSTLSAQAIAMNYDNIATLKAIFKVCEALHDFDNSVILTSMLYINNVKVLEWLIPRMPRRDLIGHNNTLLNRYIHRDRLDLVNVLVNTNCYALDNVYFQVAMQAAQYDSVGVFIEYMSKHSRGFSEEQLRQVVLMAVWVAGMCLEWCWDHYNNVIRDNISAFVDESIPEYSFASVIWLMKHGCVLTAEQHRAVHSQIDDSEEVAAHMLEDVAEIDELYNKQRDE